MVDFPLWDVFSWRLDSHLSGTFYFGFPIEPKVGFSDLSIFFQLWDSMIVWVRGRERDLPYLILDAPMHVQTSKYIQLANYAFRKFLYI